MTLDEAIAHCKEKSKGTCKCAKEHEQLLQWLIDYKELKKKETQKKPLIAFADGVTVDGSIVRRTALVCPFCKSLLIEGQKYCHSCGQKLEG